ncbi:hypothetical protein [Bradyrhizobium sp. WSM3983]|uniref:hypothetical protein n=1 Tax=Bradyrhizobium sp. WSM3983 TaxID=1038867 RepID=UPI000406E742|nr:hypothetical protein [Bradyrhizobium sp. WSM3983]
MIFWKTIGVGQRGAIRLAFAAAVIYDSCGQPEVATQANGSVFQPAPKPDIDRLLHQRVSGA